MRPRTPVTAFGAGLVAVALTGCMKIDMDLELETDDTVNGSMIMAFDKNLADMMGSEFDTMLDQMLDEAVADLPEGATSEEYEDDDFTGAKYTFERASIDEFSDGDLSITHEGDEFIVDGVVDLSDDPMTDDLGNTDALSGLTDFDVTISINFPGEVLDHNGELEGTTVTWTPPVGETSEFNARARDTSAGSSLPVWLWIIIGVVAVAGLIAGLFVISRNKGAATAPDQSDESAQPAEPVHPDEPPTTELPADDALPAPPIADGQPPRDGEASNP